jgi:hypothetical protein
MTKNEIIKASEERFRINFGKVIDVTGFWDEYSREEIILSKEKRKIRDFLANEITLALEKMAEEVVPEKEHPKEQDLTWNNCIGEVKERIDKFLK